MTIRSLPLVALVLVAAACGAQQRATPAPPGHGDWSAWSRERKLAYMKDAVLPREVRYFHVYSPQRFPSITCKTCHGVAADEGSYKMPNPALPKLAAGRILELEKTKPNALHFMVDVIVPRTAELLGEPEWSHETMTGFGCFKCHPHADEDYAKAKAETH